MSGMRRNMVACVALPTCPLAFAEAERYLPTLVERLEAVADKCGVAQDPRSTPFSINLTGFRWIFMIFSWISIVFA